MKTILFFIVVVLLVIIAKEFLVFFKTDWDDNFDFDDKKSSDEPSGSPDIPATDFLNIKPREIDRKIKDIKTIGGYCTNPNKNKDIFVSKENIGNFVNARGNYSEVMTEKENVRLLKSGTGFIVFHPDFPKKWFSCRS